MATATGRLFDVSAHTHTRESGKLPGKGLKFSPTSWVYHVLLKKKKKKSSWSTLLERMLLDNTILWSTIAIFISRKSSSVERERARRKSSIPRRLKFVDTLLKRNRYSRMCSVTPYGSLISNGNIVVTNSEFLWVRQTSLVKENVSFLLLHFAWKESALLWRPMKFLSR